MVKGISRCLAVLLLVFAAATGRAATSTLGFSSLPSAQGWTYDGPHVGEAEVFSVGAGTLTLNTMGLGYYDWAQYELFNFLAPQLPFSIEITARVLGQYHFNPAQDSMQGALTFGAITATRQGQTDSFTVVDIGENFINTHWDNIAFDNSVFHTFKLSVSPVDGTFSLFVDGTSLSSGCACMGSGGVSKVFFGDPGWSVNGNVEIQRIEVIQQPVPEPEIHAMLLAGLGLLGFIARRRKKPLAA